MRNLPMTSHLLQPPAVSSVANRRVAVRFVASKKTRGSLSVPGKRSRQAAIVDISTDGVALVVHFSLRRGTRVLVRITNTGLDMSYDLAARVAYAVKRPQGRWLIGCQFARPLSDWEFGTLL
jgi:hypothetical protein